jgi:hypothetical protein
MANLKNRIAELEQKLTALEHQIADICDIVFEPPSFDEQMRAVFRRKRQLEALEKFDRNMREPVYLKAPE